MLGISKPFFDRIRTGCSRATSSIGHLTFHCRNEASRTENRAVCQSEHAPSFQAGKRIESKAVPKTQGGSELKSEKTRLEGLPKRRAQGEQFPRSRVPSPGRLLDIHASLLARARISHGQLSCNSLYCISCNWLGSEHPDPASPYTLAHV